MDDGSAATISRDAKYSGTPLRGALSFVTFLWASKEKFVRQAKKSF